jgi:hypothetical protein
VIPESVFVLVAGVPYPFTVKYTQNSVVSIEYKSPEANRPVRISWLSNDLSWLAIHNAAETKTGDCHVSTYAMITNNSNSELRYRKLRLINAALMKSSPVRWNRGMRSAPMMSEMASSEPEEMISALSVGEPRVFMAQLWSADLAMGGTMAEIATDDIKIKGITYLFDLTREGAQFPRMALAVKAHKELECPAGALNFYDSQTMLLGSGNLRDLAPGEVSYLTIADSRKIEARITQDQDDTDVDQSKAQKGTILRAFTIKARVQNPSKYKVTVGFLLPKRGRMLSGIVPQPEDEIDQGLLWLRDVDTKEDFVLRFTETVERE